MFKARMASTIRSRRRPPNGRMGGWGLSPPPAPSTFQGVGRSFSLRGAGEREATSSARDRPSPAGGGAALGADPLADGLSPVGLELGVQRLDAGEDVVGDGLLVLPARILDLLVEDGLAVQDRHLGELEALPVADTLGAVDRDGDDGGAAPGREPADARLDLAGEIPGPRAAALAVHRDRAAVLEDALRRDEGLLVGVTAPDGEDAAVGVDELQ